MAIVQLVRRASGRPNNEPTSVYRLYTAADRLLYVGMTREPFPRLDQHWKRQPWWSSVSWVRIDWYATRSDAADAELRCIRTEEPLHNVQGRGGHRQRRATPKAPEPIKAPECLTWVGA